MTYKIFVINLERRIDKKKIMIEKLSNIDYTFYEAIDGNILTKDYLDKKGISILKGFNDPSSGRTITWGEIGCALSHFNIYNNCIDNNIETAIILEDDVEIPTNFNNKINDIISNLDANCNWDVCYLAKKSMDKISYKINDLLEIPGYCYWACSYIINIRGMKKIIDSNYLSNLIPIDELIPILSKTSPYKSYYKHYSIIKPLQTYSLIDMICSPNTDAFKDSETENSKEYICQDNNLLILATGTQLNDPLHRFINSCETYGLNYQIMGKGDKWQGGDMSKGPGGGQKINYLIDHIKNIDDEQIILVSDSYDVIMAGNSSEIINKYNNFNKPIIFAAEVSCWPDQNLANSYPKTTSIYKYLNSGGFIGKVKYIKKILPENFNPSDDDQLYYTKIFLDSKYKNLVTLDYNCTIFQCLNNLDSDIDLDFSKSIVKNTLSNEKPCHIHGNGSMLQKLYLNRLDSYLSKNWTDIWGYNKKNNKKNLPNNLSILVVIEADIDYQDTHENFLNIINKNIFFVKNKIDNLRIYHISNNEYFSTNIVKNTTSESFKNMGLKIAIETNVDYVWFVNSSHIIVNPETLYNLILVNKDIVSPVLCKPKKLWSNFWGDIDKNQWYQNSFDYIKIVTQEIKGCWNVPHISGNILINKTKINQIQGFFTCNFNKYFTADMNFSKNCRDHNIFLYANNLYDYGYISDYIKDEIPPNAIHNDFYLFETNKTKWINTYLHPDFIKVLGDFDKLNYEEVCTYAYEFPLVNDLFCEHLLDEVNSLNKWSPGGDTAIMDSRLGNKGIENVPTIDIHMSQIGFRKQWEQIIHTYIAPLVSYLYSPYQTKKLNIAFVVKYEIGKQIDLKPHHDSATYSIVITLNTPNIDFKGGGTRFVKQNVITQGKKGYCTIHPGKLTHYHEGVPITDGKRFIMVSFIE